MKRIITISFLSLGIILLAGCNEKQNNQTQPEISNPIKDTEISYSHAGGTVYPPKGVDWYLLEQNDFGVVFSK